MPAKRTLYLHTLDGEIASFQQTKTFAYLATSFRVRHRFKLATSLGQIRREWIACCDSVEADGDDPQAFLARCGYVLVEVPQ